jgi:LmbE family N-acetylglucosaminyl deacetylase
MSVLVLAAHPDDEVLGCGGTIARLAAQGERVDVAILGEGITSRYADRSQADPGELEALRECSRKAAGVLRAHELHLFDLPDNRFDTVPLLDIVKLIEGLIEQIKPSVVYTQHGGDLNVDHRALYEATLAATRPLPGSCVRSVLSYEVASSTEWAFGQFAPAFHPNVFVEISDTLPAKIAAMQAYESEARAFPHPRAPESLEAMARRWGSTVGVAAAEAFALVREVR